MWKEFRTFVMRGNVVDLAVGIIIGTAFGGIVQSMVNDVVMPPLGAVIGNLDFKDLYIVIEQGKVPGPYAGLEAAKAAGAITLRYGLFINTLVNFLIVALAMFLVIKGMNKLASRFAPPAPPPPPNSKDCPYCKMSIPIAALKCGHCTSTLAEG